MQKNFYVCILIFVRIVINKTESMYHTELMKFAGQIDRGSV